MLDVGVLCVVCGVWYLLCGGRRWLFVVCCLLGVVSYVMCVLFVVRCLLFVVCGFVASCLLRVDCSVLVVCCALCLFLFVWVLLVM